MEASGKDKWDKIDIILKPVGGLFAAIAVGGLGFFGSKFLEEKQATETRVRLYTELMSKREESESALRKDMFVSIIQTFLNPASSSVDDKVLNLELLAYNFHESLNLKPLFTHLNKQIVNGDNKNTDYLLRLERVAREVTRKQLMVLEGAGKSMDRTIDMETLRNTPGGIQLDPGTLEVGGIDRSFKIYVLEVDFKSREMRIRLEITTPHEPTDDLKSSVAEFWVGFYDFPMIDNTRLPHDQRCAIVLNNFDEFSADITLSYFPGSYASLKEKPYFQEVVSQLLGDVASGK